MFQSLYSWFDLRKMSAIFRFLKLSTISSVQFSYNYYPFHPLYICLMYVKSIRLCRSKCSCHSSTNMHNYLSTMSICFDHLNSLILSLYWCTTTQFNCEKYDNQSLIGQMDRLLDYAHRTIVSEANGIYIVTYHILNSISKVIST